MEKSNYIKCVKMCHLFCLFLIAAVSVNTAAFAQQKRSEAKITISGCVKGVNKKPISGVQVRIKGLPIKTVTDYKGRYSIQGPIDTSSELVFSRRGMESMEVAANGKSTVNVSMEKKVHRWDDFQILSDFHLNKLKDLDNGLKGMAECHFTVANAANPQNIELCEELGLSVMITEAPHLREKEWLQFSDEEIDQKIKRMVENGGDSDAIIGYYLCDEPHVSAFPALAKAVAAVKKYAPGKLAYINLYPDHGTIMKDGQLKSQLGTNSYTEYLEKYVSVVKPQFICYDNYRVLYSKDLNKMSVGAGYFKNLVEVRRIATKYDLPFFNIVASNQIRPHTTIPSPTNLLLQAYTTIAAGARGVQWYTYHYSGGRSKYDYMPLDHNENKTLTWRYLEEVNRQLSVLGPIMRDLTSTGVYFTSPPLVSSLPVLPGKLVQEVVSDVPMMVGEFVNEQGENYIMVVNLSLEKSAMFSLKTKIPNEKMSIISAGDAGQSIEMNRITKPDLGARGGYWLVAGQGILIKAGGVSATASTAN